MFAVIMMTVAHTKAVPCSGMISAHTACVLCPSPTEPCSGERLKKIMHNHQIGCDMH